MSELFKGFEQLLELAKVLEEKAKAGEIKTDVRVSSRPLSSIPRQGNIPRSPGTAPDSGFPVNRPPGPEPDPAPARPPVSDPGPPRPNSASDTPPGDGLQLPQVGGLEEVLRELKELVGIPLKRPDLLQRLGLEPPKGVLLVGPPGTGKTLTARALAQDLGVNYVAIVGPEIMAKHYGEAEERLRGLFEKAARNAPCLIFIDEIDSLAPDRAQVEGEVEKRVVAQLLSLMDGFSGSQGVMVLAATNRPNHLDPALRRGGRFDREIHFPVPDRPQRLAILQILTATMPLVAVDLERLADQSLGFVGSDLKALCQKAAYTALRRQVPSFEATAPDSLLITAADFGEAFKTIKPSVLRSVEVESPQVPWDSIGGLGEIKRVLQESVEGALLYGDLYQRTGAKAPRGILLWGPPGTGKTLLAKAVASQGRANFIAVNGPELMSRWVGASEQAVRDLFAKARQAAPCVVFLDEIDTLAPVRGSGSDGVGDRLVGQLLTELDGLQDAGSLLVIGATNRRDALDPALLRSGRLDLQLKVDLPDQASRWAILTVHNGDRPLEGVDLNHWASQTEGWNGADLALLSNQAALESIRRHRRAGSLNPDTIRIVQDDFAAAHGALLVQRSA
ncbi:AAA family ATPase [Prochlorothrix hollandica]|uniref:AAA family ATPase n=1 Tax=Prochlorothrix hollandica TaxID=1223 RepID=UPI00333E98AF